MKRDLFRALVDESRNLKALYDEALYAERPDVAAEIEKAGTAVAKAIGVNAKAPEVVS